MQNLTILQAEKLEVTLNASLKSLFYKSDDFINDENNEIEVRNIILEKLETLGFKVNTSRKNEMIFKLEDSCINGSRTHIFMKFNKYFKDDIESEHFINDISNINRKLLLKKYSEIGKNLDSEKEEFLKTWYVSVVR
jgi:hypothetical protein